MTAKEELRQILSELPDNSTWEDIEYALMLRRKIQQGLADAEAGRTLSRDVVDQRMRECLNR